MFVVYGTLALTEHRAHLLNPQGKSVKAPWDAEAIEIAGRAGAIPGLTWD